jgi:RNA polymerase sigma factor (sigma-70 family)
VRRAGDPDAYVRRIVINEHRSRFRRRRVAEELRGDLADTADREQSGGHQQGPEEQQALLDALRSLGPRQRAVVVLRYWLDLSEAETAAALNCSVGTVKSQASRALATLRKSAAADDWARGKDIVEGGLR